MTDAAFRVTVPGLYKQRNGKVQEIVWVGEGEPGEFCVFGINRDNGSVNSWRLDGRYVCAGEVDEDLVELIEAAEPSKVVHEQLPAPSDEPLELRRAKAAHDLLSLYGYDKYNAEQALTHVRALRTDS